MSYRIQKLNHVVGLHEAEIGGCRPNGQTTALVLTEFYTSQSRKIIHNIRAVEPPDGDVRNGFGHAVGSEHRSRNHPQGLFESRTRGRPTYQNCFHPVENGEFGGQAGGGVNVGQNGLELQWHEGGKVNMFISRKPRQRIADGFNNNEFQAKHLAPDEHHRAGYVSGVQAN